MGCGIDISTGEVAMSHIASKMAFLYAGSTGSNRLSFKVECINSEVDNPNYSLRAVESKDLPFNPYKHPHCLICGPSLPLERSKPN